MSAKIDYLSIKMMSKTTKSAVAVNTKYFSKSQVEAEKGHVFRLFATNKNAIPELSQNNFGTDSDVVNTRLEAAMDRMVYAKEKANVLVDSVLVLPVGQLEKMQIEHPNDWRDKLTQAIESMMNDMRAEGGLTPLGFQLHLDEGTKHDDGTVTLNPHAHMLFANVCTQDIKLKKTRQITKKGDDGKALRDEKGKYVYELNEDGSVKTEAYTVNLKNKMPMQYLRGRGAGSFWARQQDIAAARLEPYGFERGKPKELTKREHLEKTAFVEQKLKEQEAKIAQQDADLAAQTRQVNQLRQQHQELQAGLQVLTKLWRGLQRFFHFIRHDDREQIKAESTALVDTFKDGATPRTAGWLRNELEQAVEDIPAQEKPRAEPWTEQLMSAVERVTQEKRGGDRGLGASQTSRERPKVN